MCEITRRLKEEKITNAKLKHKVWDITKQESERRIKKATDEYQESCREILDTNE